MSTYSPKRTASPSPATEQKRMRLSESASTSAARAGDFSTLASSANTPDVAGEEGDAGDVSMQEAEEQEEGHDEDEADDNEEAEGDSAQAEANRARLEQQARNYLAAQTHEVIIPSYAAWFDMSRINKVEERALPEFFNSRNRSKTPAIYKEYRDFIINTYRLRPREYLTVTACRRNLAGDACAILRVHAFLEQWGLINYQVDPDTRPSALVPPFTGHFRVIIDTPRGLQPLHPGTTRPPSSLPVQESKAGAGAKRATSELTLRQNVYQTSTKSSQPITAEVATELANQTASNKTGFATYSCDTCGADCTAERYHSLKANNFELCPNCYLDGRFSSKMFSGDFVRLTASSEFKHGDGIHADDWTDAEILLLLEGIEMYEDDFQAVSEHVGTRTKEQCVAQFLQLPIEDDYANPGSQGDLGPLQYARVPFEKPDNPIMSVVAFLAGAVGPGVAAAAAQAGMSELTESLKRKAAKRAEEREKAGNGVTKMEEVEDSSMTNDRKSASNSGAKSTTIPRSTVEKAAAIALSTAAAKSKALASHEEDRIRALTAKLVQAQSTKLELKLEQFEAMEELVEEERRGLEEARLMLFREKANLTNQLVELKNMVLQQRHVGGNIPAGFEAGFNALASADVSRAVEVPVQDAGYTGGANITQLH
ncbi:uncharacterized protein EI90DRAFT_3291753 [Cantharellus anzutake]|uniref:uncharacterized protein n=1 Tax=Cantharellus anzutake TaxID=1750568 RepID=UPI00190694ED|nr:uncharacterized protein EI90DRAFT_3291753 [Cantharellus anzutake]KAF8325455.1 hypothetical protein EI90DRAFT_3291753 [Cantharellus anzutake]